MYPYLYSAGELKAGTYGLLVMLAFLAACVAGLVRVRRVGVDPDLMVPLYMLAIAAGLVGSRLYHFLFAERDLLFTNPMVFFDLKQGGIAFLGGAIGGSAAALLWAHFKGMPVLKVADAFAPGMMLGLAIGRLGCMAAGCCHGAACELPDASVLLALPGGEILSGGAAPFLAFRFSEGVGVASITGVPVYPTQLWEAASVGLLSLLLGWMWSSWRRFDGQIFGALLLLYPGLRFVIEGYRGDSIRGLREVAEGLTLSSSQQAGIAVALLGLGLLIYGRLRGLAPEQPYEEPPL
jgi:phosphatidylglycerol:prolipoprotein diacylglycerol transferase